MRLGRNRHGGGVAVYCCDTLEFRKRDDIPISTLEMVCIEITPPRAKPYLVISCYRPPKLFHWLSDIQNRKLRNSETDLHIPMLRTSSGEYEDLVPNAYSYIGEYTFGTTSHVNKNK